MLPEERERIEDKAGLPLKTIVRGLFNSIDGDKIAAAATAATGESEPDEAAMAVARERLVTGAANMFDGPLVDLLENIRRDHEQTIDHETLDVLLSAEWAGDTTENAKAIVRDFADWLNANRDEIEALTIYFSQPARRSEVTYAMINSLLKTLRADRPRLAPAYVWRAYAQLDDYKGDTPASELTQLVALIRRVAGLDEKLTATEDRVRRNFQTWILKRHSGAGEKFNEEQMDWLRMIRDHIASSMRIERDDLDFAPFDAKGGLGRMYALFGPGMGAVMDEVNEALAG